MSAPGGEPTTYGDKFVELVEAAKLSLPGTALDVLTNGRHSIAGPDRQHPV